MNIPNIVTAEQKFHEFLASYNHPLESIINHDSSSFHYYKCPHGNTTDARYKFFTDGVPSGYFKCWHCNIEVDFCSKQQNEIPSEEWKKHTERMVQRKREDQERIKKANHEASKTAQQLWQQAIPCDAHPYLELKQVKSYELRVKSDGTLLIPCFNANGIFVNLEQIFLNKETNKYDKRPIKGGQRAGVFFLIGEIKITPEVIYLCEGYSTGATIFEATNSPVFVAFNCGNLPPVSLLIRKKYPLSKIVIIADRDPNNVGENFAKKAINNLGIECNANYALPDFSKIPSAVKPEVKRSDFNDLMVLSLEIELDKKEVLNQIHQQIIFKQILHNKILDQLISKIIPIDFRELAGLTEEEKLRNNHFQIIVIENILNLAKSNSWGICRNHDFIYLYNSAYWSLISEEELKTFLGDSSEKMGVDPFKAKYFNFREQLYKQFLALGNLPKPNQQKDAVLINLKNGTFKITPHEVKLQLFNCNDFLTYQLPFEYNPEAKAPIFETFLNKVLPDIDLQKILSEYLGYVFIRPSALKLEKTLLLYGKGANGKSVFYEIVRSLFGEQNTSEYSLQSLTDTTGYFRAMLANKLINYASELNGKLEAAIFKQLTSGEAVEARCPYGMPFIMTEYAKLIFNCNELPKDVEQTNAYFRRFLIVPFEVTIPDEEQDKQLSQKIITNELSGIFNWVLEGLQRLLNQKNFTESEVVKNVLAQYETDSDSVKLFLIEEKYSSHTEFFIQMKLLYSEYRGFCMDNGYIPLNRTNFKKRLQSNKICFDRKNVGEVAFIAKILCS